MTAKLVASPVSGGRPRLRCAHARRAAPVEAGQAKSVTCMACHGVDGNSANPEWPSLAGQHASYIDAAAAAVPGGRAPERADVAHGHDPLRRGHRRPRGLLRVPDRPAAARPSPRSSRSGSGVYRAGNVSSGVMACAGCHGPNGRGNPAGRATPSIQGQHAAYVAAQLRAYRAGERGTDPNQMMRNVAALLVRRGDRRRGLVRPGPALNPAPAAPGHETRHEHARSRVSPARSSRA
ncbi:MAG: c-type cytochrome [Desulfobacterales bacterium]|nr:c-type cytochrome [Desulfobacterales bacterium]